MKWQSIVDFRFKCGWLIFLMIFCTILLPQFVFANNLSISNVSLEDRDAGADTAVVEFDISWDNSWRNDINYDAVWVFLKVCVGGTCSPDANVAWTHGMLATAGDNPVDSAPGDNADLNIYVPVDLVGAFLYRKASGNGTMAANDVRLTLDYGASPTSAADTDQIQVKVFGIEMVYIQEGDFYIGDGDGTSESASAFHSGTGNAAVQITGALTGDIRVDVSFTGDDTQISNTGIGVDGDGGLDTDDNGTVDNADFPTGWGGFYLMKYEIGQSQYRHFLNTLTREQQFSSETNNRIAEIATAGDYAMTDGASVDYRQTLRLPDPLAGGSYPEEIGCDLDEDGVLNEYDDGGWIAMNYISWMDLCAYADWAGLRPMTELEFEKASRGPLDTVYSEFAWGTTEATDAAISGESLVNIGQVEEIAPKAGEGLSNYDSDTSTAPEGPIRVGFGANGSTNRIEAGAGYYGGMNLSDNVCEMTISLGNTTGRAFEGSHGDGVLTTTASYQGNATNDDWPGIDTTTARGVTGSGGSGIRGGSWSGYDYNMNLSARDSAAYMAVTGTRGSGWGGRLARTAM
ncbi:MAG: SUMF1/EgtB/PvdO family nonheme iron enzyme [Candidatus Omnitrophota bacterium]